MNRSNFVFGYGSLVDVANLERYLKRKLIPDFDFVICGLNSHRRCWNVAMDNNLNLPDYKYYRDRITGNRLDCFVTFLNIRPAQNETISGILFRVSDAELNNLDTRERNYYRVDVTNEINIAIEGTVWTYLGLKSAEQRYQTGLQRHNAVISRSYFNLVKDAYLSLGDRFLARYIATTDEPKIPIVALTRHQVNEVEEWALETGD